MVLASPEYPDSVGRCYIEKDAHRIAAEVCTERNLPKTRIKPQG